MSDIRRFSLRFSLRLALLAAGLTLQSCAGPPPPPPPAGPLLYSELRESVEGIDTSALAGVRIVIDPGHGGRYDGAVGPSGLREADVNLGVALSLWGLLSDAGADATLTRSSDRTVADGEGSSLRDDLLARSAIANDAGADVFISIHHNSDLSRDPSINRIETYHKLFDEGPSADVARALHGHLSYNIGETRGGVIPGNYLVLRTCEGAAVLGEPSFISNPSIEARLRDAGAQMIEAEAYFLGLVEYFSKGIPKLAAREPLQGAATGARPDIRVSVDPGGGLGAIDPSSIELKLDGETGHAAYDPLDSLITHFPEPPLAAGEHVVSVRVRNTAGNWSSTLAFGFRVETEPAYMILDAQRDGAAAPAMTAGVPLALEARVYDVNMSPVADGTAVVFHGNRPTFPETSLVRSGKAVCYVIPDSHGAFEVTASSGKASMGMAADPASRPDGQNEWWAFLRDGVDDSPVTGAAVCIDGLRLAKSNIDGFVAFDLPEDEKGVWRIEAPGYEWRPGDAPGLEEAPFGSSLSSPVVKTLRLRRAAGGVLKGRTFAIDPEGGGDDRAGQGPSGTDASWVDYEVAAELARLIESSGGRAVLTRERDAGASKVERLVAAERAGAFRYILISHRPVPDGGARIGHYPGSSAGVSLAESIAAAAERLIPAPAPRRAPKGGPPAVREDAGYALRQTSAPAVSVNLMPLNDRASERYISQPWNAKVEAYAVYAGLLQHLNADDALTTERLTFDITLPGGKAAAGAAATLDGYLKLIADGDGRLALTSLAKGPHTLDVAMRGYDVAIREFTWPPETKDSTVMVELAPAPPGRRP